MLTWHFLGMICHYESALESLASLTLWFGRMVHPFWFLPSEVLPPLFLPLGDLSEVVTLWSLLDVVTPCWVYCVSVGLILLGWSSLLI